MLGSAAMGSDAQVATGALLHGAYLNGKSLGHRRAARCRHRSLSGIVTDPKGQPIFSVRPRRLLPAERFPISMAGSAAHSPKLLERYAGDRMQPLQPIRRKIGSVISCSVWLITAFSAAVVFSVVSILRINYYTTEDPALGSTCSIARNKSRCKQGIIPATALVIVGGFGRLLFGIDAELIEKKLHIPTVNF